MLPEMARHALDAPHQVDHHRDSRRRDIDAALAQQRDDIVMVVAKFIGLIEARELIDLLGRKAEHLADLAHRAARAIGDDVRGHRGAAFAVAPIDVLDDLLALVAAGQVEIDIGPFAALLGKETLEQQLHLDRVDRGDPERIADRAVGRRAAPLRHDLILAAELHDVPYDQEVAGELQLLDDRELVLELAARAIVERAAPDHPSFARAGICERAQVAVGRLAGRQRVVGETIAEIGERELASIGDLARHRERIRQILEQRGDLGGRFQAALRIHP